MSIDERVPVFLAISAGFLGGAHPRDGRDAVLHVPHVSPGCRSAGARSSNDAREMAEHARRCDEPGGPRPDSRGARVSKR